MDRITAKWGNEILDAGFTDVPNLVVRNYVRVGMSHAEFGLMMNIFTFKHDHRNPYPSEETLAELMGCGTRQIRKLLASMKDKGLVIIEKRRGDHAKFACNEYNFKPLLDACCQPAELKVPTEQEGPKPAELKVPKPAEQEVPKAIGTRSSAKKNNLLKQKDEKKKGKEKAPAAAVHSSFSKSFSKDQKPKKTQDPNAVQATYQQARGLSNKDKQYQLDYIINDIETKAIPFGIDLKPYILNMTKEKQFLNILFEKYNITA